MRLQFLNKCRSVVMEVFCLVYFMGFVVGGGIVVLFLFVSFKPLFFFLIKILIEK